MNNFIKPFLLLLLLTSFKQAFAVEAVEAVEAARTSSVRKGEFPKRLWDLLADADEKNKGGEIQAPIRWNADGISFYVPNTSCAKEKFLAEQQLHNFFRSNKLDSFKRQLSYYNFTADSGKNFSNNNFRKAFEEASLQIKREKAKISSKPKKRKAESGAGEAEKPSKEARIKPPHSVSEQEQEISEWEKTFLASFCQREEEPAAGIEKTFSYANYKELLFLLKETNTIFKPHLKLPEDKEAFFLSSQKTYKVILDEQFSQDSTCTHRHLYSLDSSDKTNPRVTKEAAGCPLCQLKKAFAKHLKSLVTLQRKTQYQYSKHPLAEYFLKPEYLESRISFDEPLVLYFVIGSFQERNYLVAFTGMTPFCSWVEKLKFTATPETCEIDPNYQTYPKTSHFNEELNALRRFEVFGTAEDGQASLDHLMLDQMIEVVGLISAFRGLGTHLLDLIAGEISQKREGQSAYLVLDSIDSAVSFYDKKGFSHVGAEASQAIGTGKKPYAHYMLPRQEASSALLMLRKL